MLQVRTALERANTDVSTQRTRIAELRATDESRGAEMVTLREELASSKSAAAAAQARVAELEGQVSSLEGKVQQERARADAAMQSALHTISCTAASLVRGLRDAYFTAPPQPMTPEPGSQGSRSGASSTGDGGVLGDLDDVVGLRLCQLSHEELMGRMERYTARQVAFGAQQATQQLAAQLGPQAQGSSREGHCSLHQGSQQRDASHGTHSAQDSAGAGGRGGGGKGAGSGLAAAEAAEQLPGAQLPGVQLELMWLEGCLLLVLLELRQQARQLQEQALKSGTAGAASAAPGPTEASRLARGLVSQMMHAMATEKRQLQRRISQMESSAGPQPPLPFTAYLPLRRSLSARTSVTGGSLNATPPRPPSGRATPPPYHASPRPSPGAAVALFHTPQPQCSWARRASEPSISDHPDTADGLMLPTPHPSHQQPHHPPHHHQQNLQHQRGGDLRATNPAALQPPGADDMFQGAPPAGAVAHMGPEQSVSDMEEVLHVLDVLDDSGLRGSRGMLGLKAAALYNRGAGRREGDAVLMGPGPAAHSPFGGTVAQVAWGADPAPSYQRSLSSGSGGKLGGSGPGSGGVLGGPVYLRGVGHLGAGPAGRAPVRKREGSSSQSPYVARPK